MICKNCGEKFRTIDTQKDKDKICYHCGFNNGKCWSPEIKDIDSEIKKVAYKSEFKPIIQWECRNCGFCIKHSKKPTYCSCGKRYSFFKFQTRKMNKGESVNKTSENILLEKLADLEHYQFCRWTAYFLDNLTEKNKKRWKLQSLTPYKDLTEKEKESDRVWARKVLDIFNSQELK